MNNHALVDQPLAVDLHQIVQVLPVRHYLAAFHAFPVAFVIRAVLGPELSLKKLRMLKYLQVSESNIDIALPMLCKWTKFRMYLFERN